MSRASGETRQTSLVDGKNKSRGPDTAESRRYDCREVYRNMELEASDGETAPFRCNSWDCYCCAHRMRMNLIEEMERVTRQRPEMRRLLTLTIGEQGPDDPEEGHAYITECWNHLRTLLSDEYGDLSYIWIRHEGDDNGRPHLHLLVDRYLPQSEIVEMATRAGLGRVVDIRRVEARNAAKYLTSYLGKGALACLPDGLRRYGSSSDIDLQVRSSGESEREWQLKIEDYSLPGEGSLRRGVAPVDFVEQRQHGGPIGLDPPDEGPPH